MSQQESHPIRRKLDRMQVRRWLRPLYRRSCRTRPQLRMLPLASWAAARIVGAPTQGSRTEFGRSECASSATNSSSCLGRAATPRRSWSASSAASRQLSGPTSAAKSTRNEVNGMVAPCPPRRAPDVVERLAVHVYEILRSFRVHPRGLRRVGSNRFGCLRKFAAETLVKIAANSRVRRRSRPGNTLSHADP